MPQSVWPRSAAVRAPVPMAGHCWLGPPQETLKQLKGSSGPVSVGSLGPRVYKVLFELFKHLWQVWGLNPDAISPPYHLAGASLLCPWTWGVFFWWNPTFSCQWFFSSKLQFWSSYRRRCAQVLLLPHLFLYSNSFPPDVKNWRIGKYPGAGKDLRQKEKETTEDEMVGWYHRHNRHEFEQAPGVGDGQESLACCSPCGHKESDRTERLNWTVLVFIVCVFAIVDIQFVLRQLN